MTSINLKNNTQGGYLLLLVLVFSSIFFVIVSSFVASVVTQSKVITQRVQIEQAGHIAEAGLNYYKWCNEPQDYHLGLKFNLELRDSLIEKLKAQKKNVFVEFDRLCQEHLSSLFGINNGCKLLVLEFWMSEDGKSMIMEEKGELQDSSISLEDLKEFIESTK